jgi:hypothetical protein
MLQPKDSGHFLLDHSMWVDPSSRVDPKDTFVKEFLGTNTWAADIWDFKYNPEDAQLKVNPSRVFDVIGGLLGGRRLFSTSNGYIGLGPDASKPDDLLVIIPGCSTPMVVRKMDEYFIMIEAAYVFGLMDGEAFNLVE